MENTAKKVAVIMGSDSDLPVVKPAIDKLKSFGVPVEAHVMSAHRTPALAGEFAANAKANGFGVIIAAAGKAAHLGGVLAAHTTLPVIGIPMKGGAMDGLVRHDVAEEDVNVAWVPGAFEIPLIASKMAKSGKYDAVICLGAVIRGSTSHYDFVCNEVSKGIAAVSLETGIPVMFGVLTTENIEQAIERAGTKAGNKGYDCAVSAIEMVNLLHELDTE